MGIYDDMPAQFLERLTPNGPDELADSAYCAGFELEAWRCVPFAAHLIEWLPEYALLLEELSIHHGNIYQKLREAAVRVYATINHEKRGEAGEIALHAICRQYFKTVPISPRVFYKSSSNDVIKAFDLVHARLPTTGPIELWLGESKLYKDSNEAIAEAIASVAAHLEKGFLDGQKLLLGPQIPKDIPRYDEVRKLFTPQVSLDKFLSSTVFVIGILSNSVGANSAKQIDATYRQLISAELAKLRQRLDNSELPQKIRVALIYVPLADKTAFVDEFDRKLKGLQ